MLDLQKWSQSFRLATRSAIFVPEYGHFWQTNIQRPLLRHPSNPLNSFNPANPSNPVNSSSNDVQVEIATPLLNVRVRGIALATSPPAGALLITGSFKFPNFDREIQDYITSQNLQSNRRNISGRQILISTFWKVENGSPYNNVDLYSENDD